MTYYPSPYEVWGRNVDRKLVGTDMMMTLSEKPWYALFVKTGKEFDTCRQLKDRIRDNVEFVIPMREMKIRRGGSWLMERSVLFPGYILAHGHVDNQAVILTRRMSTVYKWIRNEAGELLPIDENEMQLLLRIMDGSGVVTLSKYMCVGDAIKVIDGPLVGLEGTIRQLDKRKSRVKISIPIYGEEKLISLSAVMIQPAPQAT